MTNEVLFQKRTVAELSENEMALVDGGSTLGCAAVAGVVIAVGVGVAVFTVAAVVGYIDKKLEQCSQ